MIWKKLENGDWDADPYKLRPFGEGWHSFRGSLLIGCHASKEEAQIFCVNHSKDHDKPKEVVIGLKGFDASDR